MRIRLSFKIITLKLTFCFEYSYFFEEQPSKDYETSNIEKIDKQDLLVARKNSMPAATEPPAPCRMASLAHGVLWTSRIPNSLKPYRTHTHT